MIIIRPGGMPGPRLAINTAINSFSLDLSPQWALTLGVAMIFVGAALLYWGWQFVEGALYAMRR